MALLTMVFGHHPPAWFRRDGAAAEALASTDLAAQQLGGMRARFADLRDRLPALSKAVAAAGVTRLDRTADVVPLLFDHAVYKSYPAALITRGDFSAMTRWLAKLTTVDLSAFDAAAYTTIDDWIIALDAHTDLRLCHSSGTTGTMSFVPWTRDEYSRAGAQLPPLYGCGDPSPVDVIYPFYRRGAGSQMRWNEQYLNFLCGGEEARLHSLYPGRASADLLNLAGRLQAARALGHAPPAIPPALEQPFADFLRERADAGAQTERFLARMIAALRGRRVFMAAPWTYLAPLAATALARGERAVFDPRSVILTGGGSKGVTPPPGWEDDVAAFAGVARLAKGYAMSELSGIFPMCEAGFYHVPPWIIPFVLDPRSGRPLDEPAATGQAAFFDLLPDTRWGGFVTGDRITLHRGTGCACGRHGPFLDAAIDRLGAADGGDDKITCAATARAYDDVVDLGADGLAAYDA